MRAATRALSLLLVLVISGCGWELRGDYDLPAELTHINVQARDTDHPFVLKVERALLVAGVEVADAASTDTILEIGRIQRDLRNVALDRNARPSEKGLWLSVPFSVRDRSGNILLAETELQTNRIYRWDPNNVVAKGEEERLIEQELLDNLVGQLMRRLRRIDPTHLSTPATETD